VLEAHPLLLNSSLMHVHSCLGSVIFPLVHRLESPTLRTIDVVASKLFGVWEQKLRLQHYLAVTERLTLDVQCFNMFHLKVQLVNDGNMEHFDLNNKQFYGKRVCNPSTLTKIETKD
jgi:hypothetical protein